MVRHTSNSRLINSIKDIVKAFEVVCSFKYVVNRDCTVDSSSLVDISCLVVGKSAAYFIEV